MKSFKPRKLQKSINALEKIKLNSLKILSLLKTSSRAEPIIDNLSYWTGFFIGVASMLMTFITTVILWRI